MVKESAIKNNYETAIYDKESNERLDLKFEVLKTFGIDQDLS